MCAIMNRKKSTKNEEVDAMAHSNTVLSQILRIFPRHEFEALCRKHPSTVQMRTFTNWTQFVVMLTAQWAGLDSLRSIVDTFSTQLKKFYHLGINIIRYHPQSGWFGFVNRSKRLLLNRTTDYLNVVNYLEDNQ